MALTEALMIARRSELVLATHWTFDQLDDQDAGKVAALTSYMNKKAALEQQAAELDKKPKMTH